MPHPAHLPRAGYRTGVPPHVAKTMRPRRNVRLAALARGHVPIRFSVLSGHRETLSNLGPVSLPSFLELSTCARIQTLAQIYACEA